MQPCRHLSPQKPGDTPTQGAVLSWNREKQPHNQAQLLSAPQQARPCFYTWLPLLTSSQGQSPRMAPGPASPVPAPLGALRHPAVPSASPLERSTAHPEPPSNSYSGSGTESKRLKGSGEKTVLTSANWWMNILYCIYIFCKWMHQGDKAGRQQEWKIFHKIWTEK